MKILFTRNNTIVSRLIRNITEEPVSHVALDMGRVVVHSNFFGVHFESVEAFAKHSETVYSVNIIPENLVSIWNSIARAEHRGYDFGAMMYLGLRYAFPRWMPKQNLWQTSGAYLCTEFVTEVLEGRPDSLVTPYGLYRKLSGV